MKKVRFRATKQNSTVADTRIRLEAEERIDPLHVKKMLSYLITPGQHGYTTVADLVDPSLSSHVRNRGYWPIRIIGLATEDEAGWFAINWPRLMKYMAWNNTTSVYLRKTGHNLRSLQTIRLQDLEQAYDVISTLKSDLLRTLPPGALLEAHNSLFTKLAEAYRPEHLSFLAEDETEPPNLDSWSVFRLGALTRKSEKSFEDIMLNHSMLMPLSMSKLSSNVLEKCPDFIRFLVRCLIEARASEGKGWQKWGIAWTKAGLVFNYQLAYQTVLSNTHLRTTLFPDTRDSPLGRWADPLYLTSRSILKDLPGLGEIARSDQSAQQYMDSATYHYKTLFQDTDPDISASKVYHDSSFRTLFRIKMDGSANILTYIAQLCKLSEQEANVPNVVSRTPTEVKKEPPTLVRHRRYIELKEEKRVVDRQAWNNYKIKTVRHNSLNLGAQGVLDEQTGYTAPPFIMETYIYKGEQYYTYPNGLLKCLPVLNNPILYRPDIQKHHLTWQQKNSGDWDGHILTQREKSEHVTRLHTSVIDLQHGPQTAALIHKLQGRVFIHHALFADGGIARQILDQVVKQCPLRQEPVALQDAVATFENFWNWIYDPEPSVRQGKYSEEFMYSLGLDTEHCPVNARCNSPSKRVSFVLDKADCMALPEVAFANSSHTKGAPGRQRSPQGINSYDQFILWYIAKHEIAEMPYILDPVEQSTYVAKRWMVWRRPSSVRQYLVEPHAVKSKKYEHPDMADVFAYAKETFGTPFTQY